MIETKTIIMTAIDDGFFEDLFQRNKITDAVQLVGEVRRITGFLGEMERVNPVGSPQVIELIVPADLSIGESNTRLKGLGLKVRGKVEAII